MIGGIHINKPKVKDIGPITYPKLFWLFMVGSMIGVPMEGTWCYFYFGHWETHVTSMWGPFCCIYGLGMAGCYIGSVLMKDKNKLLQFFVFSIIGSGIEFACGALLDFGLHMYAWNYNDQILNIRGYISLPMTIAWGLLGIGFSFLVPSIERIFAKMHGKLWHFSCIILTVFMIINLTATAVSIYRWKERHFSEPPSNRLEQMIDKRYDDAYMQHRFIEWHFLK